MSVFQAISFAGYDQAASVEDFVATIGTSAYWTAAVAEYGVGTATVQPPVRLTDVAPTNIDDSTIQVFFWGLLGIGMAIVVHRNGRRPAFNVIWRFGAGE